MARTPSSLGCEACRRQKKLVRDQKIRDIGAGCPPNFEKLTMRLQCDQERPKCGRCKRLSIACIGVGRQRLIFKPYQDDILALRPKVIPSNETSKLTSSLVHILGIEDIRYDIRVFGGKGITDLPAEIGVNPALDATVSAMVALYRVRQYNDSKVVALSHYGMALRAIMEMVKDPDIQYSIKLKTVLVMSICQVRMKATPRPLQKPSSETKLMSRHPQGWIDNKQSIHHREMASRLFRDAAIQGRLGEIDPSYIYGLLQIAVRLFLPQSVPTSREVSSSFS